MLGGLGLPFQVRAGNARRAADLTRLCLKEKLFRRTATELGFVAPSQTARVFRLDAERDRGAMEKHLLDADHFHLQTSHAWDITVA